MSEGLHPVVDLMLARMESHPEEFSELFNGGRWYTIIMQILDWSSEKENEAIREKLRDIILDKAHADAMDELLNGEERRTGMEVMRISSSGSVGIGAAAPSFNTGIQIGGETLTTGMVRQIKTKLGI
jgi:hypothetical protein